MSSGQKRKWDREEQIQKDRAQLCFGSAGLERQPKPFMPEPEPVVEQPKAPEVTQTFAMPLSTKVFCPFCLGEAPLQHFLVVSKSKSSSKKKKTEGYCQGKAVCPQCGNGMRLQTLTVAWTPETFADFVFGYSKSGFWFKVKEGAGFETWKERLKNRFGQAFWERYKALKGGDSSNMDRPVTAEENNLWASYKG